MVEFFSVPPILGGNLPLLVWIFLPGFEPLELSGLVDVQPELDDDGTEVCEM